MTAACPYGLVRTVVITLKDSLSNHSKVEWREEPYSLLIPLLFMIMILLTAFWNTTHLRHISFFLNNGLFFIFKFFDDRFHQFKDMASSNRSAVFQTFIFNTCSFCSVMSRISIWFILSLLKNAENISSPYVADISAVYSLWQDEEKFLKASAFMPHRIFVLMICILVANYCSANLALLASHSWRLLKTCFLSF